MDNSIIRSWNGRVIRQRPDGYLCLTDMAFASSKRIDNWMRLKGTASLLKDFMEDEEYQGLQPLIQEEGRDGGTFGHPDIGIQFAQWCNSRFALQVSKWVRAWKEKQIKDDYMGYFLATCQASPERRSLQSFVKKLDVGYVYVVKDVKTGAVKIGKTLNFFKRLKALQTANANKLEPVFVVSTLYKSFLEESLHIHFDKHRMNGEWFQLSLVSKLNSPYIDYIKDGVHGLISEHCSHKNTFYSCSELESIVYKICLDILKTGSINRAISIFLQESKLPTD